jgi:vacuolar-type H+-ATPase subunit H
MVLRLSELLERIRPAGTPGASSRGDDDGARASADEIRKIAEALASFEAEADRQISEASDRASEIRQDAEREASHMLAGLPDRVATARASASQLPEQECEDELARIVDQTSRDLELLDARAASEMPRLVEAAMAVIWSALPPKNTSEEQE